LEPRAISTLSFDALDPDTSEWLIVPPVASNSTAGGWLTFPLPLSVTHTSRIVTFGARTSMRPITSRRCTVLPALVTVSDPERRRLEHGIDRLPLFGPTELAAG
jgi:hypothetical protein